MDEQTRNDLIKYRIEKSFNTFKEAKAVAELNFWNLASNRLYYSVFQMSQALLLKKRFPVAKKHSTTIQQFGQHFIKTGLLSREYGKLVHRLFELRMSGDYDEKFNADKDEVLLNMSQTEDLLNEMLKLINR